MQMRQLAPKCAEMSAPKKNSNVKRILREMKTTQTTHGELNAERYDSYLRLCGVDASPGEHDIIEEEWDGSD